MSGSFPLAVTGWVGSTGFFGPKRIAAAGVSTVLTVTAALCQPGDFVGSVGFGTIGYTGAGRNNYVKHALITPDPGVDVGSISPGSVGGFNVAGVIIAKVASPFVSYLIFAGTFNLVGKTVTYKNVVGTTVSSNLDVGHQTSNLGLGAGFTVFTVDLGPWGFFNGTINPLTLTFNF